MTTLMCGYKFKPTHSDVHFVTPDTLAALEAHPDVYAFSTDLSEAMRFDNESEAIRAIYTVLKDFEEDDTEYEWTPVLVNEAGEEVGNIRPFFRVGSAQFIEQDLPRFLDM